MKPIIIMPTYNEGGNIDRIITTIFEEVFKGQNISLLVVDSASTDDTVERVQNIRKKFERVYLVEQKSKEGLASAYKEGFKWALEKDFDVFVQMDADFQHPPEILPACFDKLKDNDLVVASRYTGNGAWDKDKNLLKAFISAFGNVYVHLILHCPVKDLTGGYNIWSRKALECIDLDKIIAKGYLFQIEMKYYAYRKNMRIEEYPFIFNKRQYGKSKMNFKIMLEALVLIWKIRNRKI